MSVQFRLPRRHRCLAAGCAALVCSAGILGCGSSTSGGKQESDSGTNWSTASAGPASFSKLVAAARAEGSVTIVSPLGQQISSAWKEFTNKYGVKVDVLDQPSTVAASTIETQQKTKKITADLLAISNYAQIQQFAKEGYLEQYTPRAAKDYPASTEVKGYSYPIFNTVLCVAWNTKTTPAAVQKELETDAYKALLSPSLKGKIVLEDATVGGSGASWYANLIYNVKGYGWPYLTKLAAQDPAITATVATMLSEVESGTYDVANSESFNIVGPAAAAGAPVKCATPSPAAASQFQEAIVKGAPHPAAARLFQEWSVSRAGQEAISKYGGDISQLKGWTDNTTYASKLPWLKLPKATYLSWQHDPRLQGDNLTDFLNRWSAVFHHSG